MSDDPVLQMYEAKAELAETRQELERIRRENDELRNEMGANHLMRIVSNFQRDNSNNFETMEDNLRRLTTTVSNNDQILSATNETLRKQNETLKKLNETTETLKAKEKNMADDQTKLSGNLETIQEKVTTLSASVSNNDGILSKINETMITRAETFQKLNEMKETLKQQNEEMQALKRKIKTMEKETILLLGGRSWNKVMDSLLILQNNDESWKELNIKLPCAIWGHGAQFLNNYLYIFGGTNEKDEVLNSTYKLTGGHKWLNNSLKWDKIMDMNQKRTNISNSSVILNYRIWVIGGWNDKEEELKSVEMYDPQTNIWTNKKDMNECRSLAAAAVVNGKIFCCGGYNGFSFLKSAECYDPFSDVWTFISDMPGPNAGCGIVVMDAHLIVIGGKNSLTNFFNSVWVLDTTDKNAKWIEKEPQISRPLCEFSTAKIHDKVFVCGGAYINEKDSQCYATDSVEIFDGGVWRNGPKLPSDWDSAAAVVIPMEFARSLLIE